jgi:hypothetical protein
MLEGSETPSYQLLKVEKEGRHNPHCEFWGWKLDEVTEGETDS